MSRVNSVTDTRSKIQRGKTFSREHLRGLESAVKEAVDFSAATNDRLPLFNWANGRFLFYIYFSETATSCPYPPTPTTLQGHP
ncbi:MAG: hypothetical protein RR842_13030, partial [Gordonibacter sp.]|uniref:hypothetical protein n=1 Tax=Gordonibacter sp. TaxID=1968902 RepID=UPI002FC8586C